MEKLQALIDVTTRIDERLNSIKNKQNEMDLKLEDLLNKHNALLERIIRLEARDNNEEVVEDIKTLDERVSSIEYVSGNFETKWKAFSGYVVQLIWIVIACWVLMKLNLTTPPLP